MNSTTLPGAAPCVTPALAKYLTRRGRPESVPAAPVERIKA